MKWIKFPAQNTIKEQQNKPHKAHKENKDKSRN